MNAAHPQIWWPVGAPHTHSLRVIFFYCQVSHQVVSRYKSPALHMNFGGKISYRDPNRTLKHLYFNHTLSVSDILRPLVITTEEFAQKWTNASFEKKQKVSSSLKNCQDLSEKAEHTLKLHLVEIIGKKKKQPENRLHRTAGRVSKVPRITWPGKLFPGTLFAITIKLSVDKTKWAGLLLRVLVFFLQILIGIFDIGAERFSGLSRNWPQWSRIW